MRLFTIRLELARDPEFPEGSAHHGYEFVAPLDGEAHIDTEVWKECRRDCRVRRFWAEEDDEIGHLRYRRGGWAFHYDVNGDSEIDESGFRFDSHAFREGEYVSIHEQDGKLRTFKVVSVR